MKQTSQIMKVFFILLLVFTSLQSCIGELYAKTIINPGDNFNSIINVASAGDVIEFNPGIYNGSISLVNMNFSSTNPLIIRSANGPGTVSIVKGNYKGSPLIVTNSSYIVVDGIIFNGGLRGAYTTASNHLILINSEFTNTGQEGIHVVRSSRYVDIINCDVHNTGLSNSSYGEGIYVGSGSYSYETFPDNSEHIWIEGNEIYDCGNGEGINIKSECFHVTIRGNTIHDIAPGTLNQYNQAAVAIEGAAPSISREYRLTEPRNVWVEGNEVYNVTNGYNEGRVSNNGIMSSGSGVYVINNEIYNCDDRGLCGNGYADLGLALHLFNNNSHDNGTDLLVASEVAGYTTSDPGVNPNEKQTWYSE